jgi:hypothetical protein
MSAWPDCGTFLAVHLPTMATTSGTLTGFGAWAR